MLKRLYPTAPAHVYLFATCLVDLFVRQTGLDTVRLLERECLSVHFPREQSFCEQPAYRNGNPEEARAAVRSQLEVFGEPWPVIVPSGSCAGMMRHHWTRRFEHDPVFRPKARALAERIDVLGEFLVHLLKVHYQDTASDDRLPERVVLHIPCAVRREMGTRARGAAPIHSLRGLTRIEHERESECCGFGGTPSLRHSDISGAMVNDMVASGCACACACATGYDHLVSADCGCLLNIGDAAARPHAHLPVEHLATFRWWRTGGAANENGGAK